MSWCTSRVAQCLVHTRSDSNATKINTEEDICNKSVRDTSVLLTPKILKQMQFLKWTKTWKGTG